MEVVFPSPVGNLKFNWNGVLTRLDFTTEKEKNLDFSNPCMQQLEEYFNGKRCIFTLPLHTEGTRFQKLVWEYLRAIPFGETRTYAEVAQGIRHPRAIRAVGTAIGSNPITIIIPCHRVIRTDGSMGQYATSVLGSHRGPEVKSTLLRMEQL